jgi:hypothetical protein
MYYLKLSCLLFLRALLANIHLSPCSLLIQ